MLEKKTWVIKKASLFIFACLFASLLLFLERGISLAEEKILAVVDSEIITQKDLEGMINFWKLEMAQKLKPEEIESKLKQLRSDFLENLIADALILKEAKKYEQENKNQPLVTDAEVKGRINQIKSKFPSERAFHQQLLNYGLTQSDLEKRTKNILLAQKIIDRKIKATVVVKPAEVTNYYQQHLSEFFLPQERTFEVMTFKDAKRAKAVYDELSQGKDFSEVATSYGVTVERIALFEEELKEDIREKVFSLKENEYSGPLTVSEDEIYIFRLIEIKPGRQLELSEVQEQINNYLYQQKVKEAIANWVEELKSKSYIKIYAEEE